MRQNNVIDLTTQQSKLHVLKNEDLDDVAGGAIGLSIGDYQYYQIVADAGPVGNLKLAELGAEVGDFEFNVNL